MVAKVSPKFIGTIFILGAIVSLLISSVSIIKSVYFILSSQSIRAKVVKYEKDTDGKNKDYKFIVYQFEDKNGALVTAKSSWSSFPVSHEIGEEIQIYYDGNKSKINSFKSFWVFPTLFIVLCVFDLLVGLIMIKIGKKIPKCRDNEVSCT